MQIKIRWIHLILIVVILGSFPCGRALAFPGDGDGTETDPYRIEHWHHLDAVRLDLGAYYRLENSLDQNSFGWADVASSAADGGMGWLPLGDDDVPCTAVFDGQNYTISDVYIDRPGASHVGLFGLLDDPGMIKNLGVGNITVTGDTFVGGLVGMIERDAVVENSYATGVIVGGHRVGGLAGINYGTIEDAYAKGILTAGADGDGRSYAGGLTGRNMGPAMILRSFADVDVDANGSRNGGLTGYNFGLIFNSYARGYVTGDDRVGGLVGYNRDVINNSFSTGEVIGNSNVGGLVGDNIRDVNNSFWDVNSSGMTGSDGGQGRTTGQMQDIDNYLNAGWDIDGTGEDKNDGYPYLSEGPTVWVVPVTHLTLTIDIVGEGAVLVNGDTLVTAAQAPEEVLVPANEDATLEALPDTYWRFLEWGEALSGVQPVETLFVDHNQQVTATFVDTFILTVDIVGQGDVLVNGSSYVDPLTFTGGDNVTLEAVPDQYWELEEWTGDLTGDALNETVLIDANKDITAVFSEIEYTVEIDIEGEGAVWLDGVPYTAPVTIVAGETIQLEAIPDQYNSFDVWEGDLTGAQLTENLYVDSNKLITANFKRDTEVLTVNIVEEGTVEVDGITYTGPQVIDSGETVTLEAVPEPYYHFARWEGDLTGGETVQQLFVDDDREVTAVFQRDTHTINLTINGNGDVMVGQGTVIGIDPFVVEGGETISLIAEAAEFWHFQEWTGDITGTDTEIVFLVDRDFNLSANFEEDTYLLTIDIIGDGRVFLEGFLQYTDPLELIAGDTIELEAEPDDFWQFKRWGGDLSGDDPLNQVFIDSDKVIEAVFQPDTHILTVDIFGEGDVLVDGDTYTGPLVVNGGETRTLTAQPAEFWHFTGWTGDLSGVEMEKELFFPDDRQVNAWFQQDTHLVNIDIQGGGTVLVDGDSYLAPVEVLGGETISLEAISDRFYHFSHWEGDLTSTDKTAEIMVDSEKNISAIFERDTYILTADFVGAGQLEVDGTVYQDPMVVIAGDTVELEAVADQFWHFKSWGGELSGSELVKDLFIDEDKFVELLFQQDTHILTVNRRGEGLIRVDGDSYIDPVVIKGGETAALEVEPAEFYHFVRWEGDLSSTALTEQLFFDDDKEVTAVFVRDTYLLTVGITGEGQVLVNGETYQTPVELTGGETALLKAVPDEYWFFHEWGMALSGSDTLVELFMRSDKQVSAVFGRDMKKLTVTVVGEGFVLVDNDLYYDPVYVEAGDTVKLEIVEQDYWNFVGWGGALSGTVRQREIYVEDDKQILAVFDRQSYLLSIDIQGTGEVLVDGDKYQNPLSLTAGETVLVEAVPVGFLRFEGWTGDFTGETETLEIYLNSDKQLVATFAEGAPGLSDLSVGPNPFRPDDGKPGTGSDGIWFHFDSREPGPFKIKIYSIAGRLVYSTSTGDIRYRWDTRNNSGDLVNSGYYLYSVEERSTGQSKTGRLAIIRWD